MGGRGQGRHKRIWAILARKGKGWGNWGHSEGPEDRPKRVD